MLALPLLDHERRKKSTGLMAILAHTRLEQQGPEFKGDSKNKTKSIPVNVLPMQRKESRMTKLLEERRFLAQYVILPHKGNEAHSI